MEDYNDFRPRKLYRDTRNSWVAGVFSGIAEYLNISVGVTRLLGIVGLSMTGPLGVFAYIAAAFLLKPLPASAHSDKKRFRTYAIATATLRTVCVKWSAM